MWVVLLIRPLHGRAAHCEQGPLRSSGKMLFVCTDALCSLSFLYFSFSDLVSLSHAARSARDVNWWYHPTRGKKILWGEILCGILCLCGGSPLHTEWHLRLDSFLPFGEMDLEVLGPPALHWRSSAKFPTAFSVTSAKIPAARFTATELSPHNPPPLHIVGTPCMLLLARVGLEHACMHAYIHTYIHAYTQYMHACIPAPQAPI